MNPLAELDQINLEPAAKTQVAALLEQTAVTPKSSSPKRLSFKPKTSKSPR